MLNAGQEANLGAFKRKTSCHFKKTNCKLTRVINCYINCRFHNIKSNYLGKWLFEERPLLYGHSSFLMEVICTPRRAETVPPILHGAR